MKRLLVAGVFALATLVAAPHAALAAPILPGSQLGYTGVWTTETGSFVTSKEFEVVNAHVNLVSGSFAGTVDDGDSLVHATPIVYDPINALGYNPLWAHGSGLSFFLTSYSVVARSDLFLSLAGIGYFSGAGFDPTPGEWQMSLNRSTNFLTGNFSSTSAALEVPEPAALGLLGLGLVAAGRSYRRRRA